MEEFVKLDTIKRKVKGMNHSDIMKYKTNLLIKYLEVSHEKSGENRYWYQNKYYKKYDFFYKYYLATAKYLIKLPRPLQSMFKFVPDFFYRHLFSATLDLYKYLDSYSYGAKSILNFLDYAYYSSIEKELLKNKH